MLRYLDCPLTLYLEKVTTEDAESGMAQFAAAMMSFMGLMKPPDHAGIEHRNLQHRNLQGLMEMLSEGGYTQALAEITGKCRSCTGSGDCPVGEIILKH